MGLTLRLEVWQLRQDWVVRFLRLWKRVSISDFEGGTVEVLPFPVVNLHTDIKVHDFAFELERLNVRVVAGV